MSFFPIKLAMDKFNTPQAFAKDEFSLFQKGVSDDPGTDVYINRQKDFAFLSPTPQVDYVNYLPRYKKLNLQKYKDNLKTFEKRLSKIAEFLPGEKGSLLEIGSGDGSFLGLVKSKYPGLRLVSVEKDQNTLPERKKVVQENYNDIGELLKSEKKFEIVCFFHVLEHFLDPASLLTQVSKLMDEKSLLIIEVPSLNDPLVKIYNCGAYKKFYFQRQHPFVYSHDSLRRLMHSSGFQTLKVVSSQRYGLENHLNWLVNGSPGGNKLYQELFKGLEENYAAELERSGNSDTVFWIGNKAVMPLKD